MNHSDEPWDTCQIEAHLIRNSRITSKHSNDLPVYWFQFVAVAYSEKDRYIAARSDKVPFMGMTRRDSHPKPTEARHQSYLDSLSTQLTQEGWEPIGQGDVQWWTRQFRRPSSLRQTTFQKVKTAVLEFLRQ